MRIQKWLSELGLASRREAEGWIRAGRVAINGEITRELGKKIDPETDRVTLDGKGLTRSKPSKVYWLLNKPDKTLTSRKGEGTKSTIFDLPSLSGLSFDVAAAGRLDYRSEGLLILSNDGELIFRLIHPKYKVPRHYSVLVNGKLSGLDLKEMTRGVTLSDGPVDHVRVKFVHSQSMGKTSGNWYFVTVHEGRNRLVRRLFEHFGLKVVRLVRNGLGDLRLPENLPPGKYVQLKPEQIKYLKEITGLL